MSIIAVKRHRAIVIVILLGLTPLLVGCGKRTGLERFPVHGTVTLANGEKFSGSIIFLPATGPAATTGLKDGAYQFDRNNGPVAGAQKVVVKRSVARSRIPDSRLKQDATPTTKTEWNESVEVSNDGHYLHDFTLED